MIPSPGDVIFFDNDGDGIADHVGIITDVTEKEEDGQELITVAQSNHDGLVEEQEYQTDDERIVGQGSIIQNDYPNLCTYTEWYYDIGDRCKPCRLYNKYSNAKKEW